MALRITRNGPTKSISSDSRTFNYAPVKPGQTEPQRQGGLIDKPQAKGTDKPTTLPIIGKTGEQQQTPMLTKRHSKSISGNFTNQPVA